ncbi:MAG TPA: hypothetical protein VE954_08645 [Oligoflexus sp.]|uniref:hypothetical protein n=1 Tax=Oligoflexus sp. TaxID=1971216 RepID=UPI002D30F898|nr:hypothetical protein [Oligoflexus sp.]HYX33170.1 hypothetical protein [Oligoflexus sp.]
MVNDPPDKKFKEGVIPLSKDDIETLARTMERLTDEDLKADVDRDLLQHFGAKASARSLARDPTALDDRALWSRIEQAASQPMPASVTTIKPKARRWAAPALVLAAAAAVLLAVRPWETSSDPTGSNLKGVEVRTKGCALAARADAMILDPELKDVAIPASTPILLLARCQGSGILHLQLLAGSDHVSFPNIRVEASSEWQELRDQNQAPLGVMTPVSGQLQITYGLSAEPLSSEQFGQLEGESSSLKNEPWLWTHVVQWPIREKGAQP